MSQRQPSDVLPLLDSAIAEGPLDEDMAVQFVVKICAAVQAKESRSILLPEHIQLRDTQVIIGAVQEEASPSDSMSELGPFLPPEFDDAARALTGKLTALECEAANVWNIGLLLYTLLAGYPPFQVTSAKCPFFAEYEKSHRLACPEHFSTPIIEALCSMLTIEPAHRTSLDAATDRLRARLKDLQTEAAFPVLSFTDRVAQRDNAAPRGPSAYNAIGSARVVTAQLAAMAIRTLSPRGAGLSSSSKADSGSSGGSGSDGSCGGGSGSRGSFLGGSFLGGSFNKGSFNKGSFSKRSAKQQQQHNHNHNQPALSPGSDSEGDNTNSSMMDIAPPVVGPHGTPAQTGRSVASLMVPHPNSPKLGREPSKAVGMPAGGRPLQPVAVMYSPESFLPRKVSAGSTAGSGMLTAMPMGDRARPFSANAGGSEPTKRRAISHVKRLGWDVSCDDVDGLQRQIAESLGALKVGYQTIKEGGANSVVAFLTQLAHIEDGMGSGAMRANVILTRRGPPSPSPLQPAQQQQPQQQPVSISDPSPKSPPGSRKNSPGSRRSSPGSPGLYRIDVTRYTGDTFQFHAFYRQLRDTLLPIKGASVTTGNDPSAPSLPAVPAFFGGIPGFTAQDRAPSRKPETSAPSASTSVIGEGSIGARSSQGANVPIPDFSCGS